MLKLFFVLTGFSPIFSSSASADRFTWENGGCSKYNGGGRYLGKAEDYNCSGSNRFTWESGFCSKYNGGNRYLGRVEDYNCSGSNRFTWDTGQCSKYNGGGRYLGRVEDYNCSGVKNMSGTELLLDKNSMQSSDAKTKRVLVIQPVGQVPADSKIESQSVLGI